MPLTALAGLQVNSAVSYAVAVILPALDAIFPVLPSETVIIALGVATAGSTDPRIALLAACSAAGAFLGDNLCYLLGRRFGPRVERRFFRGAKGARRRAGAERSLERFGMPLIVVCRFIPGGRTAVTLCCGMVGYQRRRFIVATAVAGMIWAAYSFLIGRPGRPGLRGQAVGRIAAGVRRHDGRQRADRGNTADQIQEITGTGRWSSGRYTGQVEADDPGRKARFEQAGGENRQPRHHVTFLQPRSGHVSYLGRRGGIRVCR